ncbi:Hypothetical_protein [Hexamita inflata]|uniref:Hypothetical_protein n=1 Tax=Hexamita inflata TaxID=28002 RepID=A0AA86UF61_9EUKA|nr:Hypothetical protein HINF_LOCUS26103 [Hexamita inflata]
MQIQILNRTQNQVHLSIISLIRLSAFPSFAMLLETSWSSRVTMSFRFTLLQAWGFRQPANLPFWNQAPLLATTAFCSHFPKNSSLKYAEPQRWVIGRGNCKTDVVINDGRGNFNNYFTHYRNDVQIIDVRCLLLYMQHESSLHLFCFFFDLLYNRVLKTLAHMDIHWPKLYCTAPKIQVFLVVLIFSSSHKHQHNLVSSYSDSSIPGRLYRI